MNTKKKIEIEWNAKGNPYPCSKCRQGEWIETSIPYIGFHNDKKCICDCHTSHPTPEPSEKWEREFDEKYGSFELCERICKADHDRLKEYISNLLTQQREELIEKIEKNLVNIFPKEGSIKENKDWSTSEREMYEDCLTAIQHYLNSLKGERKGGGEREAHTRKEGRGVKKLILDLCGGTGSWSAPYKEAGYDVRVITLPEHDVRTYTPPDNVYGILAAPPCTMFSLARTTAKTPRDLDKGMEIVIACMNIIWKAKPTFWAMENPKGLLRKFMGKPAFAFDASEFGEDYNKHTDLWGYFKEPRKINEYIRYSSTDKNSRKLPAIPEDYIRDTEMTTVAIKRSITPKGFANAFYKANK